MEDQAATRIEDIVADLDAVDRGFVLGLLLESDSTTIDAAGRLAEPAATRCREALVAFSALARPDRLRWIGLFAREALAPWPAGIENVHEDTLREALQEESEPILYLISVEAPPALVRAAASVARGRAVDARPESTNLTENEVAPDVVAELRRALVARIVPVPPVPPGGRPTRLGRVLGTLPRAELRATVVEAGAAVLGLSLHGADAADLRARARALVAATDSADTPQHTLERLGARELGDRLAREDPDLAVSVAQRLAGDLRRELLAASPDLGRKQAPRQPDRRATDFVQN